MRPPQQGAPVVHSQFIRDLAVGARHALVCLVKDHEASAAGNLHGPMGICRGQQRPCLGETDGEEPIVKNARSQGGACRALPRFVGGRSPKWVQASLNAIAACSSSSLPDASHTTTDGSLLPKKLATTCMAVRVLPTPVGRWSIARRSPVFQKGKQIMDSPSLMIEETVYGGYGLGCRGQRWNQTLLEKSKEVAESPHFGI